MVLAQGERIWFRRLTGDELKAAPKAEAPVVAAPAPILAEPAPLCALTDALAAGAAFTQRFSEGSEPFAAAGLKHAIVAAGDGARLRLSGGDPAAKPSGVTGGYTIRLPDEIETAASGRAITLRVLGRSPEAAEARVGCAYSTNDVGNSGWRWLRFGPEWTTASFDYNVPRMNKGNGDFVGLLPAAAGEPAVEIAGFAIDIAG